MKVFITGADGMLGSNLVRILLSRGHEITAFLLENTEAKTLQGLNINRIYGNILNPDSLNGAVAGCDAMVHTAAITKIYPERNPIVRKVNIDGTQNVINAALGNKVKRMVFVGTANSFGFGSKDSPGDETRPYISSKYELDYMDSKRKALDLVLDAVKNQQLPALVVNPTFMFGAYDSNLGAGTMIQAIYQQSVPGFAPGGRNYVHAKDVATAIANGLTKGRIGECYIAGNQNLSYKEAFTKIAETLQVNPPKVPFPKMMVSAYGMIGSAFAKLSGKPPKVSYAMAKISNDEHYFSSAKAIKELDMPQTDIEVAIIDCFNWLKENGFC